MRQGVVVSDKMHQDRGGAIDRRVPHPAYGKMVTRTKKVKAHDEENSAKVGDTVRIMETRPLSKDKRWRWSRSSSGRAREPSDDPTGIRSSRSRTTRGRRRRS
jgi:small subunit ribosomal protein S17